MQNILGIYGVPEDVRTVKLKKVFETNYREDAHRILKDFKEYVKKANEQAFNELLKR